MAVYFVVMLLPYQKQDKKSWKPSHNRHYGACGLYGTYQSMQDQLLARGATPWCSDSPKGDTPQYNILNETLCRNAEGFVVLWEENILLEGYYDFFKSQFKR